MIQEHHALFYEKSLQVNHRQNTQKERARYCEMGREGERRDRARVRRGFLSGTFLVLTIILNQHKIFWDIATGHICTKLFRDACKYYNRCSGLFLFNGFSGAMTSTRITMRFSINFIFLMDILVRMRFQLIYVSSLCRCFR